MSIIINKPIKQHTIHSILNNLTISSSYPKNLAIQLNHLIFFGSSLLNNRKFILYIAKKRFNFSIKIVLTIIITISQDILKIIDTSNQSRNTFVALNYSSWSQKQLKHKLIKNNWIVVLTTNKTVLLYTTPIIIHWDNILKMILSMNIHNIIHNTGNF